MRVQVIEANGSEVSVEFTAGHGGQTQRGFLIKSEGSNSKLRSSIQEPTQQYNAILKTGMSLCTSRKRSVVH